MIETQLEGKTVLVTGAGAGIGRTTALRFAREGMRVAGWDVSDAADPETDDGATLARELAAAGASDVLLARVDVTDADAVETAMDELVDRLGAPHVLVNNAGITRDAQLVKVRRGEVLGTFSEDAWDRVIDVNLKGVFLVGRAAVARMIGRGGGDAGAGGVVLNASSVVGLYGNFGQTNYAASKAGVLAMTRTWSRELGRHGIRVNAVAPGFVGTAMVRKMPSAIRDTIVSHTPLGRLGEPEEVAEVYVWLASAAASFVTGAVVSVDGGLVVGS